MEAGRMLITFTPTGKGTTNLVGMEWGWDSEAFIFNSLKKLVLERREPKCVAPFLVGDDGNTFAWAMVINSAESKKIIDYLCRHYECKETGEVPNQFIGGTKKILSFRAKEEQLAGTL